ncbi:effector-associated constant component EACC1, partial [Streptomyces rimosus]|uniref:effector-associated constant component EACC1 n=1 Tax=Streptomyces rimosus TaxID=1927 RepID=UPI0006B2669A
MSIQVRLDDAGSDRELRSLCDWLADDPAVGRSARVSLRVREAQPGKMGLGFEAVQLIVDSAFQLSSLALAIDGWRRAYAARPRMTVERNGVRVSFATADTDGARSILRALAELERLEEPTGPDGPTGPEGSEGPEESEAPGEPDEPEPLQSPDGNRSPNPAPAPTPAPAPAPNPAPRPRT